MVQDTWPAVSSNASACSRSVPAQGCGRESGVLTRCDPSWWQCRGGTLGYGLAEHAEGVHSVANVLLVKDIVRIPVKVITRSEGK